MRRARPEPPPAPGELDLRGLPTLLGRDDPVILELGCNDGTHTLQFLRLFAHAKIYAFEPDPRARERFRANVRDARVKVFEGAVAADDGIADFHVSNGLPSRAWAARFPRGWDQSGSIRKPTAHLAAHPWCTFDEVIRVRTTRLDTWCAQEGVGDIDFIWADVQGAEGDVIAGGREALARTRFFYTEYSDHELYEGQIDLRGILKLLPSFTLVCRFPNDVLLMNRERR